MTTIILIALGAWILLSIPLALVVDRTFARTSMAYGDHHSQTDLVFIGTAKPQATRAPLTTEPGDDRLAS